ncbi:metallophosphoesterase [Streptomyces sp. NPDC049879]|uniref:metallophosphoesterase family protein n=1 Tax=Streptomyces sp. NPDC049879 TaxID=3365598 RepID=UPI0037A3D958
MTRVLVVGDVHGNFEALAAWSAAVRAAHGPVDAILAVGDVEPNRDDAEAAGVHGPAKYRRTGDFPYVHHGLLDLGAPLHFIGGNHEPWPALDAAGPGRWSGDVYFLGRAGTAEVAGLRVAFLSGIHSPRVSEAARPRRETLKDRTYYSAGELARVRRADRPHILLTHDWPAGIGDGLPYDSVGRPELLDLTRRLRPRWHFCGHMHRRHHATVGPTEVVCLAHIRDGAPAFALIEPGPDGELGLAPVEAAAPA